MSKSKKLICGFSLIIILMFILMFRFRMDGVFGSSTISEMKISLNSGFYAKEQKVTVKVPKGAEVYYTVDCTEPDKNTGMKYETPISIIPDAREQVYVYRFKAYYANGEESDVETRTYFVGNEITSRYTTNVLHITGTPEDLFGYENGILVGGKLFDEFVKANPDAHFGGGVEANFEMRGKEAEREVYIECFAADGSSLFAQAGGIRVHGTATRLKNQKSFRLYARKEYDEQNEFRYPIVKKLISNIDGTVAQKHKRLVIRNAGTDNGFGYIRSELIGELASAAGFPDVMHSDPICVYINGEYQGIYWIENNFDAQYFENRYGEYTGEFVILEGMDKYKSSVDDAMLQQYVDEYNEMYNKFSSMDLTDDSNYEDLCEVLDVENYLAYFAIENYIGNMDWPDNNLKAYRYVAEDNEYIEGTVFDGKYRHLLYDIDGGFGLFVEHGCVGIAAYDYTMNRIMGDNTPLFVALMKREDCRNYFINYSCDLRNGVMSLENVSKVLEEKHGCRNAELYYMLEETDIQKDSLWIWEGEEIEEYENVEKEHNEIRQFVEERGGTVLVDMILTFGFDFNQAYTLNVNKGNCLSNVQVNSISVKDESFSGPYLGTAPVIITPNMAVNEKFEYWVVNGEIRKEEKLVLTGDDIVDAYINVEMVVSESESPILQLSALRAKGRSDFIEIINMSNTYVSTKGYYLTDDDNLEKYALPVITLLPGQKIRFYGKACMDLQGVGEYGMNFNIKEGETVSLIYEDKVLETLYVPDLSSDGIYQRMGISEQFVEYL